MVERVAERLVLRLVPAAPEPEDQPAVRDEVECGCDLREHPRRSERRRRDERPDLDSARDRRGRREQGERLVDPVLDLLVAVQEVIGDPQAVGAAFVGQPGQPADLGPGTASPYSPPGAATARPSCRKCTVRSTPRSEEHGGYADRRRQRAARRGRRLPIGPYSHVAAGRSVHHHRRHRPGSTRATGQLSRPDHRRTGATRSWTAIARDARTR